MTVLAIADPTIVAVVLELGGAFAIAVAWFVVFVIRNLNALPKEKPRS